MEQKTVIELEGVDIFQGDSLILKDVNYRLQTGEFNYLIGETGSGKSSLLRSLYADIPITKGKATITGFNLPQIKDKEVPFLRRNLGIVFQDFQLLFDRSLEENLIFTMKATGWKDKAKMKDKVAELLAKTGLKNKGYKMPFQLSGGEQQRLGIARALVNDPLLILADEPTGNLDPISSGEIMELLFQISSENRAVLMATHDYSLFSNFKAQKFQCADGKLLKMEVKDK
ncbi:MAG: ATP-binding cassette domain-containing protein [Bacteroidales bacterium]|nr:ATP-binding cassette domain-containing protein [Bacteroidales bacterium]